MQGRNFFFFFRKCMKKKSNPGWDNSTGNTNKKSTKTGQNDKTKERCWNMVEQKRKGNTRKINRTPWGNKPESTGERRKIKDTSTKGKRIQIKQNIPKENSTNNWEEMTRKGTNNRMQKKPNDFGKEIMATKKHNGKSEWIKKIWLKN